MPVVRRRWTTEDEVGAPSFSAGPALDPAEASAVVAQRLGLEPSDGDGRLPLRAATSSAALAEASGAVGRRVSVVRHRGGPRLAVVGDAAELCLGPGDVVLVCTWLGAGPPPAPPGPGPVAVVGRDGAVTDTAAGALSPDTDWSYVADSGLVDGRLHRVRAKPPRAWVRGPTLGALAVEHQAAPLPGNGPPPPARIAALGWRAAAATGALLGVSVASVACDAEAKRRRRGQALARHLAGAGPLWIKLGQIASARPDLVSAEMAAGLADLRHAARRGPAQAGLPLAVARLVEQGVLADVERRPRFTGSVADVFVGRLGDGRPIACKVVRPERTAQLATDLRLLGAGARLVGRLPGVRRLPVRELAAEVDVALSAQVDLALEAERTQRFRDQFHGRRGVVVPEVYDGPWRGRVLVTEYLDGLVQSDQVAADGETGARLARNLLHTLYDMIFGSGLVHLDLHPGNVLVDRDGRIVLVDFGLSAQLDRETRDEFADLFLGMATGDAPEVARIVYETALAVDDGFDRGRFLGEIEAVVARHHGKEVAEFEVAQFVVDLMQSARRNGLRIATRYTRILLALVVFEGTLRAWDPRLDFQYEARVFIGRLRSGTGPVAQFTSGRSAAVSRPQT